MGVGPPMVTPSDPLAQSWLPAPMTLSSTGLIEVLVPKGGTLPPRDTIMIPLNWKIRLHPSHFRLLTPLNQQENKGISVLTEVIDPDHQAEIRLPLHKRGMEEYV